MTTPATEEYLELLYRLGADREPVRPASIARELGVSTASVTEMLSRLETKGLVTRTANRHVILTDDGTRNGRSQVRKHRLVEQFLHGMLGRPWDEVHDDACRFEHVMSPEITESLDRALGSPATCPHGNPIPPAESLADSAATDFDIREEAVTRRGGEERLSEVKRGEAFVLTRIAEERTDLLRYLFSLGLLPGVTVRVEQVSPFGGPVLIAVGESRYALGRDVAEKLRVRPANEQMVPQSIETSAFRLSNSPA